MCWTFVLLLLLAPLAVHAETKETTVRGALSVGSLDSGIEGTNGGCSFLTNSRLGKSVFKTCKFQDECEITGIIDDKDNLVAIKSIRKIDTTMEPSGEEIIQAVKWAYIQNNDADSSLLTVANIIITRYQRIKPAKNISWAFHYEITIQQPGTQPTTIDSGHVNITNIDSNWHYYK